VIPKPLNPLASPAVQALLQKSVERLRAERALVHWSQHLDALQRIEPKALRDPFRRQQKGVCGVYSSEPEAETK